MKISTVYFSATHTTKKVVTTIAQTMGQNIHHHNITTTPVEREMLIPSDEVLLVGMPVYGGRIPSIAVSSLQQLKGEHTPAVLVAVYGNRAYEDALVEMQDILEANGFFVMAAGAFIAQHSIFPQTATGRPDETDLAQIKAFALRCKEIAAHGFEGRPPHVTLPGNHPYKTPGNIPLKITVGAQCTACGACIKVCPAGAIPVGEPQVTDYEKCIHCGSCISVCTTHARHYQGLLFKVAGAVFRWKNRSRKEPEFFF